MGLPNRLPSMQLDANDIDLIELRIIKVIEDSVPKIADELAKRLVPIVTAAVVSALTKEYPPDQYGDKAKGVIDWNMWLTNVLTGVALSVLGFIGVCIYFYLKAKL